MSGEIIIIADDREKKVTPFIHDTEYEINWIIKRMIHADYVIMHNGLIIALIERKRWNDLSGSIIDKRIMNIENLKVFRARIDCRLIMIIEGIKPSGKKRKRGVPYKAMRAKLDHLMIRDNIMMDYTTSPKDTAKRIAQLAYNITTLKDTPTITNGVNTNIDEHTKAFEEILGGREQCEEIKTLRIKKEKASVWCTLPGVSCVTMDIIRDAGFSLLEILTGKLSMTTLSALTYPETGIKIGYERAAKIIKQLGKYDTHVAALSSIRGVSSSIAKTILNKFDDSMTDFAEDASVIIVSEIKHKRKKIGKAVAQRVFDCLNSKITDSSDSSDSDDD